jgi:hypothetical protein
MPSGVMVVLALGIRHTHARGGSAPWTRPSRGRRALVVMTEVDMDRTEEQSVSDGTTKRQIASPMIDTTARMPGVRREISADALSFLPREHRDATPRAAMLAGRGNHVKGRPSGGHSGVIVRGCV